MAANLVCKLRMQSINIIEYAFYEKPITSNRTLQSDTALNQNCLIKSLANEVEEQEQRTPLHKSATQSATARRTKKLLAKCNWFRQTPEGDEERFSEESSWEERSARPVPEQSKGKRTAKEKELRISTVMFVEFTKGGSLQKSIREVVDRITPMLGFRMRVTEKGGTQLGSLLSRTYGVASHVEDRNVNPVGRKRRGKSHVQ